MSWRYYSLETPKCHCRCNNTRVLLWRKFCANHATSTALHMHCGWLSSIHNCAGLIWTKAALDSAGLGKCGVQCKT